MSLTVLPAPARPAKPQGVRALLWLRVAELRGEDRSNTQVLVLGSLIAGWCLLSALTIAVGFSVGSLGSAQIGVVAAGAWPLWALVPLLGGGGGEVVAAHRLAAFPVSARSAFFAAWATVFLDVPYIAILPALLALETAKGGPAGLLAGVCFVAGASGLGQLAAWGSSLLLAGRKRSGVTALLLTSSVVALLALAPRLLPDAVSITQVLPPGWLDAALNDSAHAHWLGWAFRCLELAAPVLLAALLGPVLAATVAAREGRSGGVADRPWGTTSWWVRGSTLRALVVCSVRSITRAVGAQVALAGVLAVPVITTLPGVQFAQISLTAMGTVAGVASAVVLAVNAFAFDAGGTVLLFAWPVPARTVLLARGIAVAGCLCAAQVAVTLLGARTTHAHWAAVPPALLLDVARSVALAGLGLLWSIAMPAQSDYDSLRARVATPRSVMTFGVAAAVVAHTEELTVRAYGVATGAALAILLGSALAVMTLQRAEGMLRRGAGERVVAAVAS